MSKKKENNDPYFIDMNVSLEKLHGVPPEMTAPELFISTVSNAFILISKKGGGLKMDAHRALYRIRNALLEAITTKEESRAKLEAEDFRILMKHWNEQTPDAQGNESIGRVEEKLREAQSRHDRNERPEQ